MLSIMSHEVMEAAAKAGLLARAEEVFRHFLAVTEWHAESQEDLAARPFRGYTSYIYIYDCI